MFQIRFVENTDLPLDVDWAITRDEAGQQWFFVKSSKVCPEVLTEAWIGSAQQSSRLAAAS